MTSHSKPSGSQPDYLDKAVLKRAVRKGISQASEQAIETTEFLVTTEDGWIVKKFRDGKVERIRKLDRMSSRDLEQKLRKLAG